ncbi:hypothetical protein CKN73_05640 [Carnobacterium divergens]|uniref:hypothetical protein n=1 Tax=Carnobacterium divergens TaxID=2748 RepID=UPI001072664E|nr:hypothetical protein [Carnobacterium divergens]TFJ41167.1 hypothetical protein CKN77_05765 [Carnobacterium divergens]TFJ49806.1 hypothetical protein CKN73_05640 [Carnobacterium divergens]TFJ55091.1 hypothetical protein CKN83_05570 [Carnobacterium divergens]TFJ61657.1 hypothetical protein CKN89_05875 [Carnobacterium divergens]TFJ71379.1 hypothetical protein CKN91_05575 [Carnobacterium divergens]
MRIEDNWEDAFLYYVEFQVKQGATFKIIRKNIVLYEEMKKFEIMNLIEAKFGNVISVQAVEFYDDILLIKE